jgi:hypothetical protein
MLSTGTPLADSTDTKVCRISRGAQAFPSPAFSVSPWNARITLFAFSGVPTAEAPLMAPESYNDPLTCAPSATRTRDLLLRRHFHGVAE